MRLASPYRRARFCLALRASNLVRISGVSELWELLTQGGMVIVAADAVVVDMAVKEAASLLVEVVQPGL